MPARVVRGLAIAPAQPMRPHDVSCSVSRPSFRLGVADLRHLPAAFAFTFLFVVVAGTPAMAQSFDPSVLAPDDQAMIQNALEFDRTDTPRQLPSSRATFVITRTETRPRICRWFTLARPGGPTEAGVGCRVGNRQWSLAASPTATGSRPVVAIARPTTPAPTVTTEPTVATAPAGASLLSPGPAVAVTAPPATPEPPVVETAALAPTERRDFPRPDRRPGSGIPLTAAPFDVRGFPVPPRPPGLVATASPELPLAGDTAGEQAASLDNTSAAPVLTRLDPPPDIPPSRRRPGEEQVVTVTIARFPEGSAEPDIDEREAAEPDAVEAEPVDAEAGDIALLDTVDRTVDASDDGQAITSLERLAEPPVVPLPDPRPDALARYAPPSGAAAGIPQPERKPTPPA